MTTRQRAVQSIHRPAAGPKTNLNRKTHRPKSVGASRVPSENCSSSSGVANSQALEPSLVQACEAIISQ